MVFMSDNINFSYRTSLHGGSDLINIDFEFLYQMNDYSFFKDKIHITLGRDQLNWIPVGLYIEDRRDVVFITLLSAPEHNLDSNLFRFCALLHWWSLHRRKIGEICESVLQYISILASLLHFKNLQIQKILEGMASSIHSCELMLLDIRDFATLVRTSGICEGVASYAQCGLGRTRMFHFDKEVPPELSSKHTEKPNGKLLFPLNTEVVSDKSLGQNKVLPKRVICWN